MFSRVDIEKFKFSVYVPESMGAEFLSVPKSFGADILVCPFSTFEEIDLTQEISGGGDCLCRICALSKKTNGTIFCGIKTRILNVKHLGVAACNKGRLVDIVDRTVNLIGDEYEETNMIKVFDSHAGRIGLLIDTDCLLEKNWEKIAPFSDVVLCLARGTMEYAREEVRLFSAAYGIPYLYTDEAGIEWKGEENPVTEK